MRNKKKIGALVLAGTMMFSMGTSVFAEETIPTVDKNGQVSITKDFVMAEGIDTPASTFKFTAISTTKGAPEATIENITFSETDKETPVDGIKTVSKNSNISFNTFPHAGEYVYTVTETKESATGVEYSEDTYTLRVYVKNGDSGLEIRNMTAEKGTSDGTERNKVSEMKFTNTYRKKAPLEITKVTTGELADKTKDFEFTITIIPSKTEKNQTVVYTGKIGDEEVTVNANQENTFQLHDGETLKFDSLPAGTRYVVTETGANDGYTPSVTVIENGTETVKKKADSEAEGISSVNEQKTNLVGEKDNKVTFTNTYNSIPLTGIFMNNLPFVIVIGIAVLALGTLAVLKKQKNARQ